MKGIILAGDSGTRLHLLTIALPKHLLLVYDVPMIFYPLRMLIHVGIKDILIITTEEQKPLFIKTLGNGNQFDAYIT